MNITLKDLSRNDLTEQEYHEHLAISHTDIYKYYQDGFGYLSKRRQPISSDALTFGSMVDKLVTEPERFQDEFIVMNMKLPTGKPKDIAEALYNKVGGLYDCINKVDKSDLLAVMNDMEYYNNRSDDSRIKSFVTSGGNYYNFLCSKGSRTVVEYDMYTEALDCVRKIKNTNISSMFGDLNIEGVIQHFQLKFIVEHNGIEYKFMPDLVIQDDINHRIILYDLKTTSRPIYDFPKQYLNYGYDCQQLMYTVLMRDVIKDTAFDKYDVLWGGFVVVSRADDHTPILFKCDDIMDYDPFDVGVDMYEYISQGSQYPNWINKDCANDVTDIVKQIKSFSNS